MQFGVLFLAQPFTLREQERMCHTDDHPGSKKIAEKARTQLRGPARQLCMPAYPGIERCNAQRAHHYDSSNGEGHPPDRPKRGAALHWVAAHPPDKKHGERDPQCSFGHLRAQQVGRGDLAGKGFIHLPCPYESGEQPPSTNPKPRQSRLSLHSGPFRSPMAYKPQSFTSILTHIVNCARLRPWSGQHETSLPTYAQQVQATPASQCT